MPQNCFYCIGKKKIWLYNKVKFPWTVRICKVKRTCAKATFLIISL